MAEILIDEITNGTLGGNGVFDVLMKSVTNHLEREFKENRITGLEYSQVYLQVMQSTLQQSITFILSKQQANITAEKTKEELTLLAQKVITEKAQTETLIDGTTAVGGVIGKQAGLYQAQTDGFKRDAEQKLAKIMTDSYHVRRTTNNNEPSPLGLQNTDISKVVEKAASEIGVALDIVNEVEPTP